MGTQPLLIQHKRSSSISYVPNGIKVVLIAVGMLGLGRVLRKISRFRILNPRPWLAHKPFSAVFRSTVPLAYITSLETMYRILNAPYASYVRLSIFALHWGWLKWEMPALWMICSSFGADVAFRRLSDIRCARLIVIGEIVSDTVTRSRRNSILIIIVKEELFDLLCVILWW